MIGEYGLTQFFTGVEGFLMIEVSGEIVGVWSSCGSW